MKVLFLVISLSLWSHLFAISKEQHQNISNHSKTLYLQCMKQIDVKDLISENINQISLYTKKEEEHSLTKLLNWHFYDKNFNQKNRLPAWKTMHRVYSKRIDEFRQAFYNKDKEFFFESSGRVLHYLQDVAVPSTVAPNFDINIFLMNESDYFEVHPYWSNHSFTIEDLILDKNLKQSNKQKCLSLYDEIDRYYHHNIETFFQKTLKEQATKTLERIKEKIPQQKVTWEEAYWYIYDSKNQKAKAFLDGFAKYGKLKNRGFKNMCEKSNPKVCEDFIHQSYNEVVATNIKTYMLLNRMYRHMINLRRPNK